MRRSRLILANACNCIESRKKPWPHEPGTIQSAKRIVPARPAQKPKRKYRIAAVDVNVAAKSAQQLRQAVRIEEVHMIRRQHVRVCHIVALQEFQVLRIRHRDENVLAGDAEGFLQYRFDGRHMFDDLEKKNGVETFV